MKQQTFAKRLNAIGYIEQKGIFSRKGTPVRIQIVGNKAKVWNAQRNFAGYQTARYMNFADVIGELPSYAVGTLTPYTEKENITEVLDVNGNITNPSPIQEIDGTMNIETVRKKFLKDAPDGYIYDYSRLPGTVVMPGYIWQLEGLIIRSNSIPLVQIPAENQEMFIFDGIGKFICYVGNVKDDSKYIYHDGNKWVFVGFVDVGDIGDGTGSGTGSTGSGTGSTGSGTGSTGSGTGSTGSGTGSTGSGTGSTGSGTGDNTDGTAETKTNKITELLKKFWWIILLGIIIISQKDK